MFSIYMIAFCTAFGTVGASSACSQQGNSTSTSSKQQMRAKAQQQVDKCNQLNAGIWMAKLNERFAQMDDEAKQIMNGLLAMDSDGKSQPIKASSSDDNIDANMSRRRRKRATSCTATNAFDSRTQWSGCAGIINKVQDQSGCGDCWAVASASAFNDRYCIQRAKQSEGTPSSVPSSYSSSADILACSPNSKGCDGGSPYYAWAWIKSTGVVSGTDYPTNTGCKPYPFPPQSNSIYTAPSCATSCSNSAWIPSYKADKKYATWTQFLQGSSATVAAIQKEIKANGTVVASMDVYEDFYHYSTGVYTKTSSTFEGSHAVRLIGWGTQTCTDGSSQDYWLAVNSWNTDWGMGGLFMIARGVDMVGIESGGIFFGTPKV